MLFPFLLLFSTQVPGGSWDVLHRFSGSQAGEKHGFSMDWLGDLDRDGCDDLIVGSTGPFGGSTTNVGSFTVYSGKSGTVLAHYDAQSLPSPGLLGNHVSRLGDVTGDGVPEFAVSLIGAAGTFPRVAVFTLSPLSILYEVTSPLPPSDFGEFGLAGGTDLSGDGIPDLAVTDATYSYPVPFAGAIHAFNGRDGSLLWTTTGGGTVTNLGSGVGCPGDLNGDGYADVIASSLQFGATVHVLSGRDGSEMYQIVGVPPLYFLGVQNMADTGDVDGDGLPDFMLGATEVFGLHQGYGIVYRGYDGQVLYQIEGPRSGERFGSVLGAGDFNGDGIPDFPIAATDRITAAGTRGGIYVYSGRDLEPLALLESPAPPVEAFGFGFTDVLTTGDANGDGRMDVLAADFGESPGGIRAAGSAYVFSFDPYLTAGARSLSSSAGGTLTFHLDFPASEAGLKYRLLASEDLPGWIALGGVGIPLLVTPLLQQMVFSPPALLDHPRGTLDAGGDAVVSAALPPHALAAWVGRSLKFAAISETAPGRPSRSSAPAWVEILP